MLSIVNKLVIRLKVNRNEKYMGFKMSIHFTAVQDNDIFTINKQKAEILIDLSFLFLE